MDEAKAPPAPRVTRLGTTPVKGLQLHHPEEIWLNASGAAGDRDFFWVNDRNRLVSITRCGGFVGWAAWFDSSTSVLRLRSDGGAQLAGEVRRGSPLVAGFSADRGVPGYFVDGPWNELFSGLAGQQLRLVQASTPGDGSDEHPVTLVSEESLEELAKHAGVDSVDPRRFRMTIQLCGVAAHEEDTWHRAHLQIGDTVLRVGRPVPRCAAVTRNPETGDVDLRTLHLINAYRGLQPNEFGEGINFGVYAEVVTPGRVSVGDEIRVVSHP